MPSPKRQKHKDFSKTTSIDCEQSTVECRSAKGNIESEKLKISLPEEYVRVAFNWGLFDEVDPLADRLRHEDLLTDSIHEFIYLAAAGKGESVCPLSADSKWKVPKDQIEFIQNSNPLEAIWFKLHDERITLKDRVELVEDFISQYLRTSRGKHLGSPSVLLNLADWSLNFAHNKDVAISLVCGALGYHRIYTRIDDILLLASLLNQLHAPKFIWTSIVNIYTDFLALESAEKNAAKALNPVLYDYRGVYWKIAASKNDSLRQLCDSAGLSEIYDLLDRLEDVLHIRAKNQDETIETDDKHSMMAFIEKVDLQFPGRTSDEPGEHKAWISIDAFQLRHPWFALLKEKEQKFLRNGDHMFATCPTDDFSSACAQWWRCLESVLRRLFVQPAGELIDANPSWYESDRQSPNFSKHAFGFSWLAESKKRRKLTLKNMLDLLTACLNDCRKQAASDEAVRANVVEYVANHLFKFSWLNGLSPRSEAELVEFARCRGILGPADKDKSAQRNAVSREGNVREFFSSSLLTEESIKTFRNATSHDQPMNYNEAIVGRLVAIRILEFLLMARFEEVA